MLKDNQFFMKVFLSLLFIPLVLFSQSITIAVNAIHGEKKSTATLATYNKLFK